MFGCKAHILNTKDYLGNFTSKSTPRIFLGYSKISRAYRVYNKNALKVEETTNVIFDEENVGAGSIRRSNLCFDNGKEFKVKMFCILTSLLEDFRKVLAAVIQRDKP